MRSPSPARPVSVSARPPSASTDAAQFSEAAGDQRGPGRGTQPARHRRRRRPAHRRSSAHRRVRRRSDRPRRRGGRSGRRAPRRRPSVAARSSPASVTAVGRPAATSAAKLGPDSTIGNGAGRGLGEDLALALQRAVLEALGGEDHRLAGERPAPRSAARLACAGTARMTRSAPGEAAGGADRSGDSGCCAEMPLIAVACC